MSAFSRVYTQMCDQAAGDAGDEKSNTNGDSPDPSRRRCPSRVWVESRQRLECAPRFLFLGAAKAGTTSCFHFLSQHPQVSLPADKEPHFFGTLFAPARGTASAPLLPTRRAFEDDYLPIFPDSARTPYSPELNGQTMASTTTTHRGSGGSITGEASVAYLYAPGALAAISHFLPSGRFVALLREPSARALSEYNSKLSGRFVLMHTQHRSGRLKREERDGDAPTDGSTAAADRVPDFSSLVWEARRAMAACAGGPRAVYSMYDDVKDFGGGGSGGYGGGYKDDPCFVNSFIAQGNYARPLERWLEAFGEQVLVEDFTALAKGADGAAATMRRIAEHIGLDPGDDGNNNNNNNNNTTNEDDNRGASFGGFDTSLVYNTAQNPGCGQMNALPRSALDPQATLRPLDDHTLCTMRAFFAPFNRQLIALLVRHGRAPMAAAAMAGLGARRAACAPPTTAPQVPGALGAPLNISAAKKCSLPRGSRGGRISAVSGGAFTI